MFYRSHGSGANSSAASMKEVPQTNTLVLDDSNKLSKAALAATPTRQPTPVLK